MRGKTIGCLETFGTVKEGIDEIRQLENLTYDLYGLTKALSSQFEHSIELSPKADPKNPFARLIDQSAIESLAYLVQRSAGLAEELNSKLHEAIERLPAEQLADRATSNHSFDEGQVSDLCRAVKVVSSVVADQLQYPIGEYELSEYGLEVQTFKIDASMLRYAVDHAAELAIAVRDDLRV